MRHIEDYLEKLDNLVSIFPYSSPPGTVHASKVVALWDQKFVSDVSTHTVKGSALSTAQSAVAIKILRRYVNLFPAAERADLTQCLETPVYRNELYQTVEAPREVRWAGGSTLLIRTPYNPVIISDLRALSSALDDIIQKVSFKDLKIWRVVLDDTNYKQTMTFIKKHNFAFDDNVLKLFMDIESNIDNPPSIRVVGDTIQVEINNDVLSTLWIEDMEWLRDV